MSMRRKPVRTDPRTGEKTRRPRRQHRLPTGFCRCGFRLKLKRGLLVRCPVCRVGHHT